jgi:Bacterial dnaA protein helix-turn-helix
MRASLKGDPGSRFDRRRRTRQRHHVEVHCIRFSPSQLRELIEAIVASGFDIDECRLRLPNRGAARVAHARQAAMYLASASCGLSKAAIGRMFERDRTTVVHACNLIEDQRDNPDFDLALSHLDRVLRIVIGPQETPCPLWS